MAVYHGARPRGFVLPGGIVLPQLGARPRLVDAPLDRPSPATERSPRLRRRVPLGTRLLDIRPRRVGPILGSIAILFGLGFVSLTQSVRVAATSYDLVRLQAEHDRLDALKLEIRSDLYRLGSEPAIRKLALDHGLGQLGAPIVVQAR